MIIKLYDNTDYRVDEYPLIKIKDGFLDSFKKILREYGKDENYNIEDFLILIREEKWFIDEIYYDEEIYF